MFRCLLAFFLIGTYKYSLGIPLQNSLLANQLIALANSCENSFISTQIRSKHAECSVMTTLLNEKQVQCLLFYDINKQLCNAIAASKLGLPDDYSGIINEVIDVEDTCKLASNWDFTDLAEFPTYRKNVLEVFHVKIGCLKVCGVPEVTSPDTNFFCKYFKWGLDALNSSTVKLPNAMIKLSNASANLTTGQTSNLADLADTANSNVIASNASAPVNNITSKNNLTSKSINENKSSDYAQVTELTKPDNKALPVNKQVNKETAEFQKNADIEVKIYNSEKPLAPSEASNTNALDKPSAAEIETSYKDDEDNANEIKKNLHIEQKQNKNVKPVDQPDPDYNDSDEAKEGLVDGDDNGDDPGIGAEVEPKPEITQPQNNKRTETSMSFVGEREFYPMQEQFEDDDDHFFPFFLTGIILVVLLYILYHNKSKVSKVVLGLIVEGRQSGRRRNSRGHAYRRLDTLEQAMSTNSAAPPSKIIY